MHTPAEGRKVAGKEEKCTQCMERNLLCAVQVEHSTWFCSKSLSLHCVHLSSFLATSNPSAGAYGALISNSFSSRLMQLVQASHHFQCRQ